MQNFSARTGISLAADSTDGYQIPPGLPQNDFCLLMQNYKHMDELTVLRAFDSIMTNLSYEVLSDMILNLGTRLLRGQASLLFIASDQGQREEAYAGPEPNGTGDLRRLLVEMSDFVLQSKRPLSVPDASQSPWTQYLLDRQEVQGSITITPLLQQERIRGTLGIYAAEPSRDPESDLHLLSMLAAQAVNSLVMLERLVASEEQALTDSLTGLYNYRFFQDSLQRELRRASRSKAPLSLIVLDLDNFKVINDSYGHGVGDRVLRHLADLIQRHSRKANVVVRYGGDEVCIIVAEGDVETARAVAERVLAEIRNSPYADEAHGVSPLALTVSAGVTSYRPEEDNTFSFFKRADENLLTAKRTGKDRVVGE